MRKSETLYKKEDETGGEGDFLVHIMYIIQYHKGKRVGNRYTP